MILRVSVVLHLLSLLMCWFTVVSSLGHDLEINADHAEDFEYDHGGDDWGAEHPACGKGRR